MAVTYNQSNHVYLHDVTTEKATLSFSNGANRQNGEGIRDKGHLFITSILQNALSVNPSAQENSSDTHYSLDFEYLLEDEHELKPPSTSEGEKQKNVAYHTRAKSYKRMEVAEVLGLMGIEPDR
jgi:hypothetical protein